jgi:5-(carboxyamino)imidazole ribonucleotide synthase
MKHSIFPPKTKQPIYLGVLGGGQLGRMFVQAAQTMGYRTVVLDPDPNSPAGGIAHHHIHADYLDEKALAQMADLCDAVTIEFENVPHSALSFLSEFVQVSPASSAVTLAQNRLEEKNYFSSCGVPYAPYAAIHIADDIERVDPLLFPAILKTARMGYDGKGQLRVPRLSDLRNAWNNLGAVPCVLEKLLSLKAEYSVILACGFDGAMVHLPLQRNFHTNGILTLTEVFPDGLNYELGQRAIDNAKKIASSLNYVGILCVEFFIIDETDPISQVLGCLVINEMAPRPHNSGHYSIEALDSSQFDLQVRTMTSLPLFTPRQHSPAAMINLMGDMWYSKDGVEREPPWELIVQLPGVYLHLYGKNEARVGRKMGHITVTAASSESVRQLCMHISQILQS